MKLPIYFIFLIGLLILPGCGSFQPSRVPTGKAPAPISVPAAPGKPGKVVKVAHGLIGTPYKYGGTNPRGFDCSGFTSYVFKQAGIKLPRTAKAQFKYSQRIKRSQLSLGDLLFFRLSGRKISHVAIYAGDNRFIHAPSSGKQVSYDSLDNPFWEKHWVGAGRVF